MSYEVYVHMPYMSQSLLSTLRTIPTLPLYSIKP